MFTGLFEKVCRFKVRNIQKAVAVFLPYLRAHPQEISPVVKSPEFYTLVNRVAGVDGEEEFMRFIADNPQLREFLPEADL
jgi:hypothetical protein